MAHDRSAYHREYYLANKERIKQQRYSKPDNLLGLFDRVENVESCVEKFKHVAESEGSTSSKDSMLNVPTFNWWIVGTVVCFIAANTFFLVHEQTTFFLLKNYDFKQAAFFAVLIESALLLLSFLSGHVPGVLMRVIFYSLLLASISVSAMIVISSVKKRDLKESASSEQVQDLKKQIQVLERREAMELANIEAIDSERYPTKRAQLSAQLQTGMSAELAAKRRELSGSTSVGLVEGETSIMVWLRLLAIAWNVVLIHSLGMMKRITSYCVSSAIKRV